MVLTFAVLMLRDDNAAMTFSIIPGINQQTMRHDRA